MKTTSSTKKLALAATLATLLAGPVLAAPPYTDAQPVDPADREAQGEPFTAHHFVTRAAISGQKEVYLGNLAKQKSSDERIRTFADRMVRDHSDANDRLAALARTKGIELPPPDAFESGERTTSTTSYEEVPGPSHNILETGGFRGPSPSAVDASPIAKASAADAFPSTVVEKRTEVNHDANRSVRLLRSLSGVEFDRAYLGEMVRDHSRAVRLFTNAQQLDDPDIKRFASDTLPTLREHLRMADQLVDQIGPSNR